MTDIPEAVASCIILLARTLETLETPAVLVEVDVAERNLARWKDRCAAAGLRDRPHIKTHRTIAFARRQIAHGAIGVTCQTVGEAEIMAAAGIDDILITTNSLGRAKLARLVEVARQCRLTVVADSLEVASAASEAATPAGVEITVLVECETGARRCGVADTTAVVELARRIADLPGLTFGGLATYPPPGGRAHNPRLCSAPCATPVRPPGCRSAPCLQVARRTCGATTGWKREWSTGPALTSTTTVRWWRAAQPPRTIVR
jgi:D-serine deaminase-like pyridoxal phosphate-dependent protein